MGLFDSFRKKSKKSEAPSSVETAPDTSRLVSEGFDLNTAFSDNLKFISRFEFSADEIHGLFALHERQVCVPIGEVGFPTGEVVVADPLCYLPNPEFSHALNHAVAPGSYQVILSVNYFETIGVRVVAAKLSLTDTRAVRYEVAMPKGTAIEQLNEPGILTGFGVDAGLACFCDKKTAEEYAEFISQWHRDNPGKNHYDDYFDALFAESYAIQPDVQREGGDFIVWAIPHTGNKIAMVSSGLGDGFYQSFWGFDADSRICELVIPFINPDLFVTPGNPSEPKPDISKKKYHLAGSEIKELLRWNEADGCFATDRIMVDGCKVGYMYREAPDESMPESGWRFFAGDEDDSYINNPDLLGIYSLNTVANYDQDIIPFLHAPYGSAFVRDKNGAFQEDK